MHKEELSKIDECRFRIPKSYKKGMRVDGIIYADDKLINDIKRDNAFEQVANTAFLPGIVKNSLAMPDIHWGYGFCLTKDAKILNNFGYHIPIGSFGKHWRDKTIKCIDLDLKMAAQTSILKFIKLKPKKVFRVVTKEGCEIRATPDHPFLTPSGMRPLEDLSSNDKIAIFPFEGVPYQEPSQKIIISEGDIRKTLVKLGRKPFSPKFEIVLRKLKERKLLPLAYNHPKLPFILKIMGFVFGDGSMNFIGKRGDGVLHFSGKPQDLEEARKDLINIGYTPSPIHFQKVNISQNGNKYYNCYSFLVNASSLVVLLETLGVPRGTKVSQAYRVPKWIFKAPLWQKRLFLAALFGCELRKPHRRLGRRGYFNAPVFPMAKREELVKNGNDFLKDISRLLKEFGVRTFYINKRKKRINTKGKVSWALELLISPKPENLLNLWSKIGFEYNAERSFIANVAVQYLKLKIKILKEKEKAIKVEIPQLLRNKLSYKKIALQLAGNPLTKRFIMDVCWKLNRGKKIVPRIPFSFPSFENYLKEVTQGLSRSGMVWSEIKEIKEVPYKSFVYDFTVSHPDHNFIANNFVVSNCIGGVAATDPEEGGVISPGGVGFDINCLSPDTMITSELGYRMKIKDFENIYDKENIACIDFSVNKKVCSSIRFFLKRKPRRKVFKVKVYSGNEIIATEDHPLYTKDGMKEIKKLLPNEEVAIYPFEGNDYQNPSSEIIVDEDNVKRFLREIGKDGSGNGLNQILFQFRKKKLLPLRYNSPQLPFLLKLMGYCFGDGIIYFTNKTKKGVVCFYGEKEDLMDIRNDLSRIGFDSGGIYSRQRHYKITTFYSTYEFERKEFVLKVTSSTLATLLGVLGTPVGNKCRNPYPFPSWLFKSPLWQKRLFLASFFGAELSAPKTMTGHGYNFYCPTISMNKIKPYLDNGRMFLKTISFLLSEFGVTTKEISIRKEYVNKNGLVSYRLRLLISGDSANLIKLYSKIGFEYNRKRSFLANCAVQYSKLKERHIEERNLVAAQARILHSQQDATVSEILNNFSQFSWANERFIERSIYEGRKTSPRVGKNFVTFEKFCREATEGLGYSGMVWDRIEQIEELKDFGNFVYDFTIDNPHHNFVANCFVVSNCGVRLLKTELNYDDIEGKLKDIADSLYQNVPSGLGSKGKIKLTFSDERKIAVEGAKWAIERGMGEDNDIECCEENGKANGADPDNVSKRAYERGKQQVGTLGSGNHFLEVQVIDEIFDGIKAEALGLRKGQITVMIHSGSRGFGYQICDDYIKVMLGCLSKYDIDVPDRQLACAPLGSKEAKQYLGAMNAAANYAWCNRQVLMHLARVSFEKALSSSWKSLGMELIYDVTHNIAKIEEHTVNGKKKALCVHRKGATRAFGPGNKMIPEKYRELGQPVIIPGDMGRASYLLIGTRKAETDTFASTCHGAGRVKSRHQALKTIDLGSVIDGLKSKGIEVRASGKRTIIEEAPEVYKDIDDVVNVVHNCGISLKICRMKPLCVVKG